MQKVNTAPCPLTMQVRDERKGWSELGESLTRINILILMYSRHVQVLPPWCHFEFWGGFCVCVLSRNFQL